MKVIIVGVLYILFVIQQQAGSVPLSIQSNLVEFCDTEGLLNSKDVALTEHGQASSKTVSLSPQTFAAVCKLKVTSPKNHVVNFQFVETNANFPRALLFNNTEPHPPCTMSIYLPDDSTRPFWEGDPCSQETLPDVDLLTPEFEVVWAPPPNPNHTKGRKFVITAVGKGGVCKEPGKHTCMRIGRQPIFCISEKLLCDGVHHCPKSSSKSDESEDLCNDNYHRQNSWEQLAQEFVTKFVKKFKPPPQQEDYGKFGWTNPKYDFTQTDSRSKSSTGNWKDWQLLQKKQPTTTQKPTPPAEEKPKQDSVTSILSKYGPWGYLMMGLLICGTVLMFCGLWECCFRKPKTQIDGPLNTTQPTTVLIINQSDDGQVVGPPNYDELEEPPSYNTLFPHFKHDQPRPIVGCCTIHQPANHHQQGDNTSTTSFYSALTFIGDDSSIIRPAMAETHVVQINNVDQNSTINSTGSSVLNSAFVNTSGDTIGIVQET